MIKENNPRYDFDVKNPKTWKAIILTKIPDRCDYCRRVLPIYNCVDDNNKKYVTYLKHGDKNYCDKWCRSEDGYVHGNSKNDEHKCNKCGKDTKPVYRKEKPNVVHYWSKRCEDCKLNRYKIPLITNV